MFKQVADVQTADMLNLPVPKLVGGKPINVALPPSPQQKQMVADLADRAEEIRAGNVDPTEDNMLKVTNDGRKLALDQRLIDPNLPENPNDKVHACAENVYRIWNDTKEKRLTQLVFCDLSTPKPDGFNVYDDLRNLLITMGIPENEVQFIHEAPTPMRRKKPSCLPRCSSGDVRVLMGSYSARWVQAPMCSGWLVAIASSGLSAGNPLTLSKAQRAYDSPRQHQCRGV